jgi:hypothetical protein
MYLLFADVLVVGAALAVHFFSPRTPVSTLFVIGAVVAGGLFLFVPLLLDLLRERGDRMPAVNVLRNDIADNQRVLQDDIRVFAESCSRRFSALEAAVQGGGGTSAVALSEVEARLRTALEDVQAQLDLVADSVRGFQRVVEAHAAAVERLAAGAAGGDETDGPLPSSLMAKAMAPGGALRGGAVARLIGNAAPVASRAPQTGGGVAEEDEVWTSASDMANREGLEEAAESGEVAEHSLFPKTAPVADDERQGTLGLDAEGISEVTPEALAAGENWDVEEAVADADAVVVGGGENVGGGDASPENAGDAFGQEDGLPLDFGVSPAPSGGVSQAAVASSGSVPATTLVANVLVGFGNRPYVRGSGPGLSEDIGVPMERVEAGCWRWVASDASRPVRVTLWKNDIHKFVGDPVTIAAGRTVEIEPVFPGD